MKRLLLRCRKNIWMNYYILFTRFLIGFAFIPSGLVKLLGHPFTTLPKSNPVGYFFDAMFHTGIYWNFLGFTQILAAFLLMTQRLATVGALMFLGIITNIMFITIGVGFGNTVVITVLIFLACLSLVAWDYQKIILLFIDDSEMVNKKIETDLISKKWSTFGLLAFIFLGFVCSLPYMVDKEKISFLWYMLIPIVIMATSFIYFIVMDYKQYKNNENHTF